MNSTIYDMAGQTLTQGLGSSLQSDEARNTAKLMARERGASVVVEDAGSREVYRVTPGGYRWRAPKGWVATWEQDEG